MFEGWRRRARAVEADVRAVALALRDPRTPWYARLLAFAVVAYAVSPIDLVPDFVPVLGYLDDLVLVPLGVAAVVRMIPPDVLAECRRRAADGPPPSRIAAAVGVGLIVAVWIGLSVLLWRVAAGRSG